ncbi:alpha/beta hydrolase [Streptomyces sp. SHP 1-2]|uniref:alpha/beta hydrolase n=1 Tax=Streptomyces sp. SHP 1-2 TaxID=2769489 RepID=UPI0022386845|nr:alpha/beta hydrolase [Streptomyces sp. SHP 1-2]MCW5251881.1 alpha/beta hydrolase [Streptomyces sp. SHP 1-2]
MLVLDPIHDPATPLPGGRRVARSFPGASPFTMDVVGHWLTEEALRVIDAHLTRPRGRADGSAAVRRSARARAPSHLFLTPSAPVFGAS